MSCDEAMEVEVEETTDKVVNPAGYCNKAIGDEKKESWNALVRLLGELNSLSTKNSPLKKLLANNDENITKYFKCLSGLESLDFFAGCCSFEEFEDCVQHLTGEDVLKQKFSTASSKYNGEHWFFVAFVPPSGDNSLWKAFIMDTPVSLKKLKDHPRFNEFKSGLWDKGVEVETISYEDDQGENECGYYAICSLFHFVFWRHLDLLNPVLPSGFVKFCNRIIGERNDAAIWLTDAKINKIVYMLKLIQDNFEIEDWNQASKIINESKQLFTKLENKPDDFRRHLDDLVRSEDGLQSSSTKNSLLQKKLIKLDAILLKYVKFPDQFDGCDTYKHFAKFMEQFTHDGIEMPGFCVILNTGHRMKTATTVDDESTTIDEVYIR